MFWNLISDKYERYQLHHIVLLVLLIIFSIVGAVVFCELEGGQEASDIQARLSRIQRARLQLAYDLNKTYRRAQNDTSARHKRLISLVDEYNKQVGLEAPRNRKWTIWGGLYYAGTIYTTIGYGDLAAVTPGGRIFTVLYAVIGIPLVITILNDWGTLLFNAVQYEKAPPPLIIVIFLFLSWMTLCTILFAYIEDWSIQDSAYFFFVSFTTIGFGDLTPRHDVAVANFGLILMGLSVVSLTINILQMHLERLFSEIVLRIDSDFKQRLTESDSKKISVDLTTAGITGGAAGITLLQEEDFIKGFEKNMHGSSKLLMKFMGHHQKKMLNEKFENMAKMRNQSSQTNVQIKAASVQTGGLEPLTPYEDSEEEEETPLAPGARPAPRINRNKKMYIYNTGD